MPKDTREPQEILAHVTASRVALTFAIYGLSEAELTMAGAVGRWSVKDVMAHLGRWEEVCLAEVQKHLRGEQSTEDYRDPLPYNDRWEAELHMLSLQEAIGLFETAHYRLYVLLGCPTAFCKEKRSEKYLDEMGGIGIVIRVVEYPLFSVSHFRPSAGGFETRARAQAGSLFMWLKNVA